jgi:hypothetical protein
MYVCSDLKNYENDKRRSLSYNHIELLNNNNINQNISTLKTSNLIKLQFIENYNELEKQDKNRNKIKRVEKHVSLDVQTQYENKNDIEDMQYNPKTTSRTERCRGLTTNEGHTKLPPVYTRRSLNKNHTVVSPNELSPNNSPLSSKMDKFKYSPNRKSSEVDMHYHESKPALALYSKVFDKNLEPILEIKANKKISDNSLFCKKRIVNLEEERQKFAKRSLINKQIVGIKERVHFMKGVIDYVFPKIMIDKVRVVNDAGKILNKEGANTSLITNFNDVNKMHQSPRIQLQIDKNASFLSPLKSKQPSTQNIFLSPLNEFKKIKKDLEKTYIKKYEEESQLRMSHHARKPEQKIKIFSPIHIRSVSSFE